MTDRVAAAESTSCGGSSSARGAGARPRPYYYSDAGVQKHLEVLLGIALDERTELTHSESGVILILDTPEQRLSIIANALEHLIKHFRERDPAAEQAL